MSPPTAVATAAFTSALASAAIAATTLAAAALASATVAPTIATSSISHCCDLGTLVKVGMNKNKNFKPLVKDIKARYYAKVRGGGFLEDSPEE